MIKLMSLFPELKVDITEALFGKICDSLGHFVYHALSDAMTEVSGSEVMRGVSLRNKADCVHDKAFSRLIDYLGESGLEVNAFQDITGNRKQFFEFMDVVLFLRNADSGYRPSCVNKSIDEQSLSRPVIAIEYHLSSMRGVVSSVSFVYDSGGVHLSQTIAPVAVPQAVERKLEEVKPTIKTAVSAKAM